MLEIIQQTTAKFAELAWGPWLLALLLGGGLYFLIRSKFTPFRYIRHAIDLIRGKYDDPSHPGHISHYSAFSSAMAGTIGMGNIAGVALAISLFGPGTIFWMWVTAIVGMATKFFTCSLAVMYRGKRRRRRTAGRTDVRHPRGFAKILPLACLPLCNRWHDWLSTGPTKQSINTDFPRLSFY